MKILLLDLETAPNTAFVWGLFKENIPLARLIETGYVLCWAAKWLNEEEILGMSLGHCTPKQMLVGIHKLLNEADAVVHYNGTSFDIPTLNKEFVLYGLKPPAPYKQIDLLVTARKQFRFTSNKLDHVAEQLGVGKKLEHRGFELWIDCMNNVSEKAWLEMEDYNAKDVILLEGVYNILRPWIINHPNVGIYNEDGSTRVCPKCGSSHMHKRGFAYTITGKYQRYQCKDCGGWHRDAKISQNVGPKPEYRFTNA